MIAALVETVDIAGTAEIVMRPRSIEPVAQAGSSARRRQPGEVAPASKRFVVAAGAANCVIDWVG